MTATTPPAWRTPAAVLQDPHPAPMNPAPQPPDPATQTILRQLTDAGIPGTAASLAQQQVAQTIADLVRAIRVSERRQVVAEIREAIDHTPEARTFFGGPMGVDRPTLRGILVAADQNTLGRRG